MPTILELIETGGLQGEAQLLSPAQVAADPGFEVARTVHAIWAKLAAAGLPARRQLDPLDFGTGLLPHLVLFDVLAGGADYRWRIFGSRHVAEYGADLGGLTVSAAEAQNPSGRELRTILDATYREGAPQYFRLLYQSKAAVDRCARGVMLPMRDEGPAIEVLLGAADWAHGPGIRERMGWRF